MMLGREMEPAPLYRMLGEPTNWLLGSLARRAAQQIGKGKRLASNWREGFWREGFGSREGLPRPAISQ
jgi:hypothetical protein